MFTMNNKKSALTNFSIFAENTCVGVSVTLLKRDSNRGVFL